MKRIRKIYFRIFKHYRRLEIRLFEYQGADRLIRQNEGKPESEQWVIAIPEEDTNFAYGYVYLERRERILE